MLLCLWQTMSWAQLIQPCGTPSVKSEWLKDYQAHPLRYAGLTRNTAPVYLPLTLHIVGRSDSAGATSLESVFAAFCQLNADYDSAGIQFFIEFPIRYHYNTAWYRHDSVIQGGRMMLQENVANTINVYFVASPAGNCGYNLPYAGIAMNNSCLSGHTFAHEMGHCLSMPHTFFGWEGGVSWDNSIAPNFARPAPTRVTYNYTDFKDTMWEDTLIIDTTYVEMVARTGASANCHTAADGFCDTEADYLAYRWQCDNNARSTVSQLDPDSTLFYSDGKNIMSYAYDNCQTHFSAEQIAAMNAFVQSHRQSYLYNQNPNRAPITAAANHLTPANNSVVPSNAVELSWNAVPNATHYLVQLYREPFASNTIISTTVVSDTFFRPSATLAPRTNNFWYAWRVIPYNQGYTCRGYSLATRFNTSIVSATNTLDNDWALRIYPVPAARNQSITIQLDAPTAERGELVIYNNLGQIVWKNTVHNDVGSTTYQLATTHWASGLYVATWRTATRSIVEKIVVE